MSSYGNSSQLYFNFVYSDYMKEHSEFKYLLDLIDMIDWSVVPDFNNKMGRTGTPFGLCLELSLFRRSRIWFLFLSFSKSA
ncbi:hypothetical protein [Petrotoga sibirica]|uniref:Uncharacterized protein n=1 Tax=Petrotoga sibirica DSM 13575 TaxID=1122956 RepID=A0A855MT76_9BACT|nr:hypothetical protein [Petrotoga sibirica]POZ88370.1 hypothetical protein AA80_06475 [Petrotoga sibirica DSM 13575]